MFKFGSYLIEKVSKSQVSFQRVNFLFSGANSRTSCLVNG